MKNFKNIIASILVGAMVCVSSAVAFAAPVSMEDDYYKFTAKVNGTPKAGETVTVGFCIETADGKAIDLDYNADWEGQGCLITSGFHFNTALLTLDSSKTQTFSGITEDPANKLGTGAAKSVFLFAEDVTLPSGAAIATYTFTVNADATEGTHNKAFWVDPSQCNISDDYLAFEEWSEIGSITVDADGIALTVKGDAPETLPEITEAAMPNAYAKYGAKYYFKGEAISLTSDSAEKYLKVVKTLDGTESTDYSNNTIGSMLNIVGAELSGSIVPVAVTSDATAAFSFDIVSK